MIKKNSKKATISKIVKRDRSFTADIPSALLTMLEEHTEGFLLFYLLDGKLCVAQDEEKNDAKVLGLQTMSKDYLDTVIEEGRNIQKDEVLAHIDGLF